MAVVNWSLQAYTDTAANLNARATPILEGQFAIETDNITTTPKFKIGDGVSLYSALPYANGTGIFQPLATNLTSLSGLTYASTSFVKMTAAGTFALDTATYLTSAAIGVTVQGYSASTTLLGNTTTGSGSSIVLGTSPIISTNLTVQGAGTGNVDFRGLDTATSFGSIYFNGNTGIGNYALAGNASNTFLNATTTVGIRIGNNDIQSITNGSVIYTPQVATSGATTPFRVTIPNNTGQTASTEVQAVVYTLNSTAWATSPPTTQRGFYLVAPAYSAPSGTMTTGATLAISGAPTGSGITITNPYALWVQAGISAFGGNIRMANNTVLQGFDSGGTVRSLLTWSSGDNITISGRAGVTDIVLNPTSGGVGLYVKAGGDGGIGVASPSARWHIIKTTEQLRVGYDASNYASHTISSTGSLTLGLTGTTPEMYFNNTGGVVIGNKAALATNATDGFLYVPSCAGIPTGVPTAKTGKIAVVCDSTNNKMYIYSGGAWVVLN